MYFLDTAEILQRLEFGVDGFAKRHGKLVSACCAFHIFLSEITDHTENDRP